MEVKKKTPIPVLTGLRCVAALSVVIAHTFPCVVPNCAQLPFQMFSGLGLQLFFVLSGFVIHYNYSHLILSNGVKGILNFFVTRFARIYPLFVTCLVLELLHLYGYSQLPEHTSHILPYYLTLTQTWFFKMFNANNLIYQFGLMSQVSWSISTECFFYLMYPVICFVISRLKSIRSQLILIIILSIITLSVVTFIAKFSRIFDNYGIQKYGAFAAGLEQGVIGWKQDSFIRWLLQFSPYSRVMEFILGCCSAAVYMQVRDKKISLKERKIGMIAFGSALIALAISYKYIFFTTPDKSYAWISKFYMSFAFAPMIVVSIFFLVRYQNVISQILSSKSMLRGGEVSYSLYLLHMPIGIAFSRDAANVVGIWVVIANLTRWVLALASMFGAAHLFYICVEVPARKFLRKKLIWGSKGKQKVLTKIQS